MHQHKLSIQQINELKSELRNGGSPSKLSKKYGISVASVQYHKQQLDDRPDLRVKNKPKVGSNSETLKLVLNGVSFIIAPGAKEVIVTKTTVKITY